MKPLRVGLMGLAVLLLAVVVGYGCGSGDDGSGSGGTTADGTSSGAALSKAAYIKKGEIICEQVPARYQEAATKLGEEAKSKGKPEPQNAEVVLKAGIPPLDKAIEEFEALTPPSGEEDEVEAIIDALESAARGMEEKPNSEFTGPKSPFAEFQKLTKEYGFVGCSQL